MSHSLAQHTAYTRLTNGLDVYALKHATPDVVVAECALPGGLRTCYDNPVIAELVSHLLPGSTKKHSRSRVQEAIEMLGGSIEVHADPSFITVCVQARTQAFPDLLRVMADMLVAPTFPVREYNEAVGRLETILEHAREDTETQAATSLNHALFQKGHPHWTPDTAHVRRMLQTVARRDVTTWYRSTFTAVGATLCIVGDIKPDETLTLVEKTCSGFPGIAPQEATTLHADRTQKNIKRQDIIVSIPDKINVDTLLGIPTTLTRENRDFHALSVGVAVLGSSGTSRLFVDLRTKQSLTYGAYASLKGLRDGYPGYLVARAIFPHDVYTRGLPALRTTVRTFVEKGITAKELAAKKDELCGKYVVGLASTSRLLRTLTDTVLMGRNVSYLDEYPDIINALTLREVNSAVKEYLMYDRAVTASAGAIDTRGKPLS